MYADAARGRRCSTAIATPLALIVALSLAGCSTTPSTGSASSAAPSASSEATPNSSPSIAPHNDAEGEEDEHPSVPVPEAGTASQTDAVAAATAAVTAFARPTLPEEQWWNELLPLLSQKGAVAYEGTLPSNIPVTAVTGAAVLLPASTDVATLVEVPTDAGIYVVTLVRGSTEESWLAERIRPAAQ